MYKLKMVNFQNGRPISIDKKMEFSIIRHFEYLENLNFFLILLFYFERSLRFLVDK